MPKAQLGMGLLVRMLGRIHASLVEPSQRGELDFASCQRARAADDVTMAAMIESYVDKVVQIVTNDGRNIVGVLKGFDQTTNVILEDCNERVFSSTAGVEQVALGLYIVRGDNMCAALTVTSMSMPLPVPQT